MITAVSHGGLLTEEPDRAAKKAQTHTEEAITALNLPGVEINIKERAVDVASKQYAQRVTSIQADA